MKNRPKPGEFDLIRRYFAPLAAKNPGAWQLTDDAALLSPRPGCEFVVTADAMVAGVHFLADDPASLVARKLLRVNLSDLAAMAATPVGYLLTAAWPTDVAESWIAEFTAGLAEDQVEFDILLYGGDTVSTPGPLCLSLTAIGAVPTGQALRRNGASVGDGVFVTGTIGDGALGLRAIKGELGVLAEADRNYLSERYRLPRPRVRMGPRLAGLASAAIDISDGLLADLQHICEASAVGAEIGADNLPLSRSAQRLLDDDESLLSLIATGGDDYELLFTAPETVGGDIERLSRELAVPVTRIGRIRDLQEVTVLGADGAPLVFEHTGWRHF